MVHQKGHVAPKQDKKWCLWREKRDFPKIPFQKGFLTPKQGSKGQKGYPAPPCVNVGTNGQGVTVFTPTPYKF